MSGYADEETEKMRMEWEHACEKEKIKKTKMKRLDSFKSKKYKRKRGLKKGMWRRRGM